MAKFDLSSLGIPIGPPVTKANNKTFLIYGPPGSGKTRLAASASEVKDLQKVLLIDVEAGSASIENLYTKGIDVIRPSDWDELKAVLEALLNNDDHGYQTVIIDTIGKMMEYMLPHAEKKAGSNKFAVWGNLADDTLRFIDMLHRTGMTVIVLAHTDSEKDELTGKVTTSPYFLGRKTGKEGPKIFDVIAYLYVDKDDEGDPLRILQTEGMDGIIAKDRTDTIPVLLGQPNMTKVHDYIASGVVGKGRSTTAAEDNTEEDN